MDILSKFLPKDFDDKAKVALLAGKGVYPIEMAKRLKAKGIDHYLIAFEDETFEELYNDYASEDKAKINVGQIGKLLKILKKIDAKYAIMAGQITPKKLFKGMKPDIKAIMMLSKLKRKNAETIFGAIADELSKIGVDMLDARSFLDDSVAPQGFLVGNKWDIEEEHLQHGLHIAKEIARLDIGQACVVARGTVLAVEGFEGTDNMILRAGEFESKNALLVKTVKPNQDYRFDVPVVGERTIRRMIQANIKNLAIQSSDVIILEKEKVQELAKENGIRIYSV